MTGAAVRRRYVDLPWGQVHVREAGWDRPGTPMVLLHQTPRSGDEFAELLHALGPGRHCVAVDLPGMGRSDPAPGGDTIEAYAGGVVDAIVALALPRVDVLGHHTGAVVAVEVAAANPDLVRWLVLSSCPWVDAAARARRAGKPVVDDVQVLPDGRHLQQLWERRREFYPPGRPDLLTRFVHDATGIKDPGAGHRAVGAYRMEDRAGLVRSQVLQVVQLDDPFATPDAAAVAAAVRPQHRVDIAGGMVAFEHRAPEVAAAVEASIRP